MPWESPEQFNRRELISAARYLYRHWGERMPIIVLESTSEAVSEMCVMAPVTVALERAEQMEIEHRQGVLDQARGMIGQPSAAHELLGLDILCVGDYVDLFWDDNKALVPIGDGGYVLLPTREHRSNAVHRDLVAVR
jgi:hypothetical protein